MWPKLIEIGPFTLYSFGLLVVLGFAAGIYLAARLAQERGLSGQAFSDIAIITLFAGVAGARLLFVLLNWGDYSTHVTNMLAVWQGGMSFHGGVIAGVLAGAWAVRRQGLPVLAMADAAAPGLMLGYAFGRIGCFLNGCCYGAPTHLPWGVHFPEAGPLPHHPAQLYATGMALVLMGVLIAAYRKPHRQGQILALYVVLYSIYRFLIEGVRKGATAEVLAFGLTTTQVFSLVAIGAGLAWWHWLGRNAKPAPEANPRPGQAAPASG